MARRTKKLAARLKPSEKAALRSRLETLTYELVPLQNVYDQAAYLPEGAGVTVTSSPARGMGATINTAVELAARGFAAIPHLSARPMRDRR